MLNRKQSQWRRVRRPLRLLLRGWRWGRRCVVSPRGTVFVTRLLRGGLMARKQMDFELN